VAQDGWAGGSGRHAAPGGPGERYKIGALGVGNRYWSGHHCDADDAAAEIAAAAGLPPLPPRKPVIGRRTSLAGVPFAFASIVLGQVAIHVHSLRYVMVAAVLTGIGYALFWPSVYAAYDHYFRRGRQGRRRNGPQ
jgi:MFS family permease